MIWLNPLALAGVAVIVAPILIHILVQRRAPAFPFPTLRFLQLARLAAIRRHAVEDLALLLVRAAILAIAAGALAGPFLVTPARREGWNNRVARAIVGDVNSDVGRGLQPGEPFRHASFDTVDLRDGIARAVAWVGAAPPARRELVVVAPFALGSLTRADLSAVPPEVGIRLVRSGQLPATRSFAAPPVLGGGLAPFSVRRRNRTIDFNGPATAVREDAPVPASVPVEIVASAEVKRAAEATLAAVLSQRVPAPVFGRTARVFFDSVASPPRSAEAVALRRPEGAFTPWIAAAIASLAVADEAISSAAAGNNTLVVTTRLPPGDPRTAMLFRSIFDALAAEDGSTSLRPFGPANSLGRSAKASASAKAAADRLAEREVLTIPDTELRAWERPVGDVRTPRFDTLERDDRRWWWAAALVLMAVETWLRRTRGERAEDIGEEAARVA